MGVGGGEYVCEEGREGRKVASALNDMVVIPLPKKLSFNSAILDKYQPTGNLPFLGKAREVIGQQLLSILDDTDNLDLFQLGFRLGNV